MIISTSTGARSSPFDGGGASRLGRAEGVGRVTAGGDGCLAQARVGDDEGAGPGPAAGARARTRTSAWTSDRAGLQPTLGERSHDRLDVAGRRRRGGAGRG